MEITDVQVKLIGNGDDRLKASCTIVIDGEFVIRDVKVIEGTNGLFVAMPSRKLTDHCPKCGHKNHLRARFCNHCGGRLSDNRWSEKSGAAQLHAEISHPINSDCRERLHRKVIAAYESACAEQSESEPTEPQATRARVDDIGRSGREADMAGKISRVAEERNYDNFGKEKRSGGNSSADPSGQSGRQDYVPSVTDRPSDDDFGAGIL